MIWVLVFSPVSLIKYGEGHFGCLDMVVVGPHFCACGEHHTIKMFFFLLPANWKAKSVSEVSHVPDGTRYALKWQSVEGRNASVSGRSHRDWSCVGGHYSSYYWAGWCGRPNHVLNMWAVCSSFSPFHSNVHCKKQARQKVKGKRSYLVLSQNIQICHFKLLSMLLLSVLLHYILQWRYKNIFECFLAFCVLLLRKQWTSQDFDIWLYALLWVLHERLVLKLQPQQWSQIISQTT